MELERREAVVPADIDRLELCLMVEAAFQEVDVVPEQKARLDRHVRYLGEGEGQVLEVELLRDVLQLHRFIDVEILQDDLDTFAVLKPQLGRM